MSHHRPRPPRRIRPRRPGTYAGLVRAARRGLAGVGETPIFDQLADRYSAPHPSTQEDTTDE